MEGVVEMPRYLRRMWMKVPRGGDVKSEEDDDDDDGDGDGNGEGETCCFKDSLGGKCFIFVGEIASFEAVE